VVSSGFLFLCISFGDHLKIETASGLYCCVATYDGDDYKWILFLCDFLWLFVEVKACVVLFEFNCFCLENFFAIA
jgi:hypothetical protein